MEVVRAYAGYRSGVFEMAPVTRRTILQAIIAASSGVPGVSAPLAAAQTAVRARSRIIVFDVNETLLDVNALGPHFQRILGNAGVGQE